MSMVFFIDRSYIYIHFNPPNADHWWIFAHDNGGGGVIFLPIFKTI